MLPRKHFTTFLVVEKNGYRNVCELRVTPIGGSDIDELDWFWTYLHDSFVDVAHAIPSDAVADFLHEDRVNAQGS